MAYGCSTASFKGLAGESQKGVEQTEHVQRARRSARYQAELLVWCCQGGLGLRSHAAEARLSTLENTSLTGSFPSRQRNEGKDPQRW